MTRRDRIAMWVAAALLALIYAASYARGRTVFLRACGLVGAAVLSAQSARFAKRSRFSKLGKNDGGAPRSVFTTSAAVVRRLRQALVLAISREGQSNDFFCTHCRT